MNKYQHAENSAKIFGGSSKDYEELHAIIDSNKTVTPSIFGRFFLHHGDLAPLILSRVFGSSVIGSKKIPIKDLINQHLIEDYGQVITFKDHWAPALIENESLLPVLEREDYFFEKSFRDPRLSELDEDKLRILNNQFVMLDLANLAVSPLEGFSDRIRMAVFGHALGADLLAKVIGPKFMGFWTIDLLIGYLNCRFHWSDRHRDPVPTLLDYEKHVPDKSWMHAPKKDLPVKEIKQRLKEAESKKLENFEEFDAVNPKRRFCNLD